MKEVTPDGILELGRRKVAIELELTSKTKAYYEKRFVFYRDHPAIDAVPYFVAIPKQREKLLELTRENRKIFVVLLKNFIEHKGDAYVEKSGFPGALHFWKFLETLKERRFLTRKYFQTTNDNQTTHSNLDLRTRGISGP